MRYTALALSSFECARNLLFWDMLLPPAFLRIISATGMGGRVASVYILFQGSPCRSRFILKQFEFYHVHSFIFSITFISPAYNHCVSFTFKTNIHWPQGLTLVNAVNSHLMQHWAKGETLIHTMYIPTFIPNIPLSTWITWPYCSAWTFTCCGTGGSFSLF